ncbi:MAG TPA: cupin domain-containing protein [Blastocatellia bacterium]
MTQHSIERKKLLTADIGGKNVTSVDVREIRFEPAQQTGRHFHPCPVVGYIVEGTAVYQIDGQTEKILPTGSAFYEPADTVIAKFDNASDSQPMTFITCYLLNGDQDLIRMLT